MDLALAIDVVFALVVHFGELAGVLVSAF